MWLSVCVFHSSDQTPGSPGEPAKRDIFMIFSHLDLWKIFGGFWTLLASFLDDFLDDVPSLFV